MPYTDPMARAKNRTCSSDGGVGGAIFTSVCENSALFPIFHEVVALFLRLYPRDAGNIIYCESYRSVDVFGAKKRRRRNELCFSDICGRSQEFSL